MIKEACRFTLTIILLWTVCMTKGSSANKDTDVVKDIYQNSKEELLYNENSYDDNIVNYENENYAQKVDTRQCAKNESKHNVANENKEKLGNLVFINKHNFIDRNNENQLQQEGGIKKQSIPIHYEYKETFVDIPKPNSYITKTRRNYLGHFKPGRKSPLSYLHIDQGASYKKHPDMYILNSENIDENVIRKFIGPQKKYLLPKCDINENQSVHKNNLAQKTLLQSIKMKREMNSYYLKLQLKTSTDYEGLRKVRSQWKVKSHSNGLASNYIQHNHYKYKSPLKYLHSNKISDTKNIEDESRKLSWRDINDGDKDNFHALDNKINHYKDYMDCELTEERHQVYSNNTSSKNSPNAEKIENSNVDEMPKINTETINSTSKKNILETKMLKNNTNIIKKLCNKATDNFNLLESYNNNLTANSSKGISSINSQVPWSENNVTNSGSAEMTNAVLNPEISNQISNHLKELLPKNEDLISMKNEDITHTLNSHVTKVDRNDEKLINTDVEHDAKNKIKISTSRAPPPSLFSVTPNISYIYLQPIPLSNSMYLQKVGVGYSALSPNISSENIKGSDSDTTHGNKSNDLITISIDPKTLQNRILHAEFIKKSDVKKTPDTLSIELTPKDSILEANVSKGNDLQFENHVQIAASVKNNSIFITSDKHASPDQSHIFKGSTFTEKPINIVLGSRNQENLLDSMSLEEKNLMPSDACDQRKKSILTSSLNPSHLFNDNQSLKEENTSMIVLKSINGENDLTKVILQTKDKELSRVEAARKESALSSNICGTDSSRKSPTMDVNIFKELHKGLRESRDTNRTEISMKENPSYINDFATTIVANGGKSPCLSHCAIKIKREAEKMNISKLINILKPVILFSTKEDNEGSEDGNSKFIDKVNLKESSEVNFEKGNKKVENKILEGFINSIIANYSKDEMKPVVKETTERNEDGAEALFKLLENSMPKKIDKEDFGDKKSDIWNLSPILVPETSISRYGDSSEYAKIGPFDENDIKSFLKKDSMPFLQEEIK